MVFLSTIHALLYNKQSSSSTSTGARRAAVFAFGRRQLTRRIMAEEMVVGVLLVMPVSLLVAHATMRMAAQAWLKPPFVRADVYTTLLITIVGDLFLELLLPSVQCLPEQVDTTDDLPYLTWLAQTWSWSCPDHVPASMLLAPEAVGNILWIRLAFMCVGIYLGEAYCPIVLTGGIATGKSTVAKMLSLSTTTTTLSTTYGMSNPSSHGSSSHHKRRGGGSSNKRSSNNATDADAVTNELLHNAASPQDEPDGTVYLVDADTIAHQVLLPPSVLAGRDRLPDDPATFVVQPSESVYNDVLEAFEGCDDDSNDDQDNSLLDEHGRIHRRKLGAIIFGNEARRRRLNNITHPRIVAVLLKRVVAGLYGWWRPTSRHDLVCADVPLYFESGPPLTWMFVLSMVVVCNDDVQLQRLRQRNPDLTEQQCRERIRSQMPLARKQAMADIVIVNNGNLEDLQGQVEQARRTVMARLYGIGMSLLQMLLMVGGSLSLAVSSNLLSSWT